MSSHSVSDAQLPRIGLSDSELLELQALAMKAVPLKSPSVLTLRDFTDPAIGLRIWRELETRTKAAATASSAWIETWIRHYGDGLRWRFVSATSNGRTIGIVLLVESTLKREGPLPVWSLHLGTAGELESESVVAEYNSPLVLEGYEHSFATALMNHIDTDLRWERFHLDGVQAEVARPYLEQRAEAEIREVPAHYFDLRETRANGQSVWDRLGKGTRRSIRTGRLQHSELSVEWSDSPEAMDVLFADLINLHQQRWESAGKAGCFASERFTAFHRDLTRRWLPEGRAVLARVQSGVGTNQRTIGCMHFYIEHNRLLCQLTGMLHEAGLSLGLLSTYMILESALSRGYDALDYLGGDTQQKRNLSTHANRLQWCVWKRPHWKFSVVDALRVLKRSLPLGYR